MRGSKAVATEPPQRAEGAPRGLAPQPSELPPVRLASRVGNRAVGALLDAHGARTRPTGGIIRRKCSCGGSCSDGREDERVLRRSVPAGGGGALSTPGLPSAAQAALAHEGGRPLDPLVRGEMEAVFNRGLGSVRIHTDQRASEAAASVGASAFTLGNSIWFAQGLYAPGSRSGRHLLAHELAHAVQQQGEARVPQARLQVGEAHDPAEAAADRAADAALRGETASALGGTPPRLRRQPVVTGPRAVGPPYGSPTAEQATQRVLAGAARILAIPNFVFPSVNHTNAVQGFTPDARQRHMLFEFWLAVTGREVPNGPGESNYRRATSDERLSRLAHANATAEAEIARLGPGPWPGQAGDAIRAYQGAYGEARARVMDETVERELGRRPTPPIAYEAPEFELEQQRLAVGSALAALGRYTLLTSRLGASATARFGTEIREALNQIAARAPAGSRLAGVADMPLPEAILHTRGVLNGINAILQISDRDRRSQLLASEFNVRDVADVSRVLLGSTEGLVATTCLIGSAVARLRGNAEVASKLFRVGAGQVVRRIGWVAALAQTVHGIAVLLDDRATESERLQAVFDVAMGSAGLTGAAASLGVEALAGLAGPLSGGILVTAGEIAYLRHLISGMEEGMATAGIRQSFDIVEYEAGGVAHAANELAEALGYLREASQGASSGELAAAASRGVQFKSRRLREFLVRAIDRVTRRQSEFAILFQPASWEEVRQPFEALRPALQQAHTPDTLLRVASNYLEAARDLFRNLARTIARTLRGVDRQRAGGVLPSVLGGLHDDRRVEAAEP